MASVSRWLVITSWIKLALGFSALSVFSTVYMPIFFLFLPSRKIRIHLGNLYGKSISPIVLFILGTRIKLIGKEHLKDPYPAIYLSNHSSQLDPLIAILVAPMGGCGVAKKEILSVPFFGPVVVRGADELWKNKTFIVRSGTFTVEALPAISTEDWTKETIEEHIQSIEQVYKEALGQA